MTNPDLANRTLHLDLDLDEHNRMLPESGEYTEVTHALVESTSKTAISS